MIDHNFSITNGNSSVINDDDDCCSHGVCRKNDDNNNATAELRTISKGSIHEFFRHVKRLYAAALGIEILCIAAAEMGENTGLYILGFML